MLKNSESQDFKEGSKNIAHMVTTANALTENDENEDFLKKIKEEKQRELEESFKSERYKEEANALDAKRQKAEAFYNNFRPILEFDFSPLIPKNAKTRLFKKRVKKDKKGNVIQPEQTPVPSQQPVVESKPTYEDRSYGIPLMVLMLCLLTIPYCIITIVLAVFNGFNAIFDGIARFGKPALIICGSIATIIIMTLVIYCILFVVDGFFGTNIVSSLTA